jgi:hypothetical protein
MAASREIRWRISGNPSTEIRPKKPPFDHSKSDVLMTAKHGVLKPLYNVALRHL